MAEHLSFERKDKRWVMYPFLRCPRTWLFAAADDVPLPDWGQHFLPLPGWVSLWHALPRFLRFAQPRNTERKLRWPAKFHVSLEFHFSLVSYHLACVLSNCKVRFTIRKCGSGSFRDPISTLITNSHQFNCLLPIFVRNLHTSTSLPYC